MGRDSFVIRSRQKKHRDPALANRKPERLSPHPVGATHGSRFFCHPITANTAKNIATRGSLLQLRGDCDHPKESRPMGRSYNCVAEGIAAHGSLLQLRGERHRDPWVAPTKARRIRP